MTGARIVVVEDDADIRQLIRFALEPHGFQVWEAANGREGMDVFRSVRPDLAILDIVMPEMNGMELCEEIRRTSGAPVIFLSGKREAEDVIAGLDIGADDYVTKPFDPSVLVARVKARLRREGEAKRPTALDGLEIDWLGRDVRKDGESVQLYTKERQLLFFLLGRPNEVFSITQLYENVWGPVVDNYEQTVKVHISNLRRKLEDEPSQPKYIVTIRGFGYKFVWKDRM